MIVVVLGWFVLGYVNLGWISKSHCRVVVIRKCGIFSKSPSLVVVIRNSGIVRLAAETGDLPGNVNRARTRPSAESLLADARGKAGNRDWSLPWSIVSKIPSCQCGRINDRHLKTN